jgi:predicted phage-related endonuclease
MNFQECVKLNLSPEITGNESDSNYLAAQFSIDNGEELELTSDQEKKVLLYISIQKEIKALQEQAETIKNQLKFEARETKIFKGQKVRISMPTIKKIAFDSKKFALDHPELYEKYKTKESKYRGFLVKNL